MTFKNFGLLKNILRAISEKGYDEPTLIQKQAIPAILSGKDLLAGSQTGSGKTAGFSLPLLENLMKNHQKDKKPVPRALILTPTRELAAQVGENIRLYSKYLPLKTSIVFGGISMRIQVPKLRKGVDIIVATPGRLLDLVQQKVLSLSSIEMFILDEADRMLDMGFIPDIMKIIDKLPKTRQNLLFSATFDKEIKKLSEKLLQNPEHIQIAQENSAAKNISQLIHPVDEERKSELLSFLIKTNSWNQVLVFTRTKQSADYLFKDLLKEGISASVIHGDKTQNARTKALADFKRTKVQVLVATDIAARGLDIHQLPFVVNFELPSCAQDYIHRIGRTGRAGRDGQAISLVSIHEKKHLMGIERLLKQKIEQTLIENFEPDPRKKAKFSPRRFSAKKKFSRKKTFYRK